MRQLKPGARFKSFFFFAAWIVGWFLAMVAVNRLAVLFGYPAALPRIIEGAVWLLATLSFAALQLFLMRRLLHIEPHRWLLWTLLGTIVGLLCESLWRDIVFHTSWDENVEAMFSYEPVGFILLFGIPTVFQYFSLPMHMYRRWPWLLTIVPGIALAADEPLAALSIHLSIILQSLAIRYIAARNTLRMPVAVKEPDPEPVKEKR